VNLSRFFWDATADRREGATRSAFTSFIPARERKADSAIQRSYAVLTDPTARGRPESTQGPCMYEMQGP
jgi:hypothetical protein